MVAFALRQMQCRPHGLLRMHGGEQQPSKLPHDAVVPEKRAQVVVPPLAAYFSHRMNNVQGIWYALVISFVVSTILSMAYYASGHWKKAVIKHQPVPQAMVDG